MITLASAFLYALLTNRVLLVDPGGYMPDLNRVLLATYFLGFPGYFPLISPSQIKALIKKNLLRAMVIC